MSTVTKLLHMSRQATSAGKHVQQSIAKSRSKEITTAAGQICGEPSVVKLGILKVFGIATPGILIGSTLAKNGAAWLEDNEIFIPDDDDD